METKEIKTRVKVCSLEEPRGGRPPSCGEGEGDDACELRALFPVPRRGGYTSPTARSWEGPTRRTRPSRRATCGERSACFYAAARYPGVAFRKIAVAASTRLRRPASASDADCFQESPISPCGACRQALLEYENAHGPIEVILYGAGKTYVLPSVASLLPLCFTEF